MAVILMAVQPRHVVIALVMAGSRHSISEERPFIPGVNIVPEMKERSRQILFPQMQRSMTCAHHTDSGG